MVVRDSADAGGGGGGGGGDDNGNSPGDTISVRHFRRKSISKNKTPSMSAAQQFASSNTAASAFMGGRPKSWMTSTLEGDTPLSLPVNNNQLSARRQSVQVSNTNTGRNPFSISKPNPATRTSQTASSQTQRLDLPNPVDPTGPAAPAPLIQNPSFSGRPLSVGQPPATQLIMRTDIEPPSNSTSPALANSISIPKVSRSNGSQGNVLPSPTPSDDAVPEGQHDGNISDLRNEAEQNGESNAATTSRPSPLSRPTTFGGQSAAEEHYPDVRNQMNELVQKYGRESIVSFFRSVGVPDNSVPSSSESNQVNGIPANASTNIAASTVPQKRPSNGISGPQLQNDSQIRLTELQRRLSLGPNPMDKRRRLGVEIPLPSSPTIPSSNPTATISQHLPLSGLNITTPREAPSTNGSIDAVRTAAQRPLVQPTPMVTSNDIPPARMLPPGYGLGEKKNQLLCGTTPDRPIALQNRPALSQFLPIVDGVMRHGLEPTVELPRMQLLREACQEEDWFYVALHQMYCLYDVQIQSLIDVTGLTQKHLEGFSVIKELIKDNKIIPQDRTKWFAIFPSPLPNLYARSDFYQKAVVLVKEFLWVLPGAYQRFQNDCKVRGTPPLVHELVIVMKLQSLIFQRVIFIAVRRGMWGPGEDQFTREMHDIFRENQRQYLAILDRQDTAQPASLQNIVEMHKQIALKYNDLHRAQLKHYNPRPQPTPNSPGILTRQTNGQIASTTGLVSQPMNRTVPAESQGNLSLAQFAARNTQPQLLVNTQPAQQSQGGHRAPAPINFTPPVLSPSATSQPNSAGMSSQMQTLQLQRLRENQLQQIPGQRSMAHSVSQVENVRQPTAQTLGPGLGSNNVQLPSTTNSASGHGRSWSASHNLSLASVPAGAPDPMYNPLPSPMGGVFSQSPRPVNPPHTRTQANRAGRMRVNAAPVQNAFLPPQNFIPNANPGLPNPNATALHLAHLRSPRLVPVGLPSGNQRDTKLYQYIKGFPLPPTVFPADKSLLSYDFSIDGGDFDRIAFSVGADNEKQARDAPLKRDLRPFRSVCPGSMMYRVRCVKLPATHILKEDVWVTTESKWPDHIFVDVNQDQVETRRKFHFGKDLPIDITDHVKNGQNTLKVSILRTPRENECSYAISVEAIEITSHSTVVEYANKNFIPTSKSLDAIKASLNAIPDDDEIAVVNNDVTINVADPFSARIFETPARSLSCLHRECFDLETFLATRSSKPKRSGEPCMVDEWKCPLCAGDARPHRLLIDGFLLEARREIGARGLDETKAIIVDKDGKWVPKAEPHDDDLKDDRATPSSISAPTKSKTPATEKNIVVIEIDDD